MRIAFIWQGFDGRYGMWEDGLYAAMKVLEKTNEVKYFDFPLKGMEEFNPDVVLYWEAPCTLLGKDAANYQSVLNLPYKKALLYAGGPIEPKTCHGFDLYFVESKISEEQFEELGLTWKRAFGVNTQIMKPMKMDKEWDGVIHATFAEWKRHNLFARALGNRGLAVGRIQEHDRNGYEECLKRKVTVVNELPPREVAIVLNTAFTVVNTSAADGGGQRCTLEAMACGIPVIVMNDSPKNDEYVEESLGGLTVEPTPEAIQAAVALCKSPNDFGENGILYIHSKWTEQHYADALLEGIKSIL